MKRRVFLVAVGLALQACQRPPTAAPESYQRVADQWIVQLGLPRVGIWPCNDDRLAFDKCYKMLPSQHWRGVWVTQFEGEHFCPDTARSCSWNERPRYELSWNTRVFAGRPQVRRRVNRSYAIEFIGRRTRYKADGWDPSYEIIVDRLIASKDLGPTPGLPQIEE